MIWRKKSFLFFVGSQVEVLKRKIVGDLTTPVINFSCKKCLVIKRFISVCLGCSKFNFQFFFWSSLIILDKLKPTNVLQLLNVAFFFFSKSFCRNWNDRANLLWSMNLKFGWWTKMIVQSKLRGTVVGMGRKKKKIGNSQDFYVA